MLRDKSHQKPCHQPSEHLINICSMYTNFPLPSHKITQTNPSKLRDSANERLRMPELEPNELAAESRGNGNLAHGKGFEQEEAEASRFHKECLDRSQVRDRQQPSWWSCSWLNATIYSGLQAEARTLSHCWVLPRQTDTLSGAVLCGRRIFFRAGARTWCPKADLPSAPVFCPP